MEYKDLHELMKQLTEDEMFIDWVRSDFSLHDDKWSAFVDEHLEQSDTINEAIRVVRDLNFQPKSNLDSKALWSRIEATTSITDKKDAQIFNLRYLVAIASAACIALFVFFKGDIFINQTTEVLAPVAQITKDVLPDQSLATLSPGSKISYVSSSWEENRAITLDGLAFFEVKKGQTFTVHTKKGTVTVLGTSFSVDTRFGNFEVICKSGKVKVQNNNGNEKILTPGEKVLNSKDELVMTTVASNEILPWLNGTYTFENTTFINVIAELENQYDVKIEVDKFYSDQRYTGFFKTGNLEEALFSVTWPMKLKYDIKGSRVRITPN